MCRAKNGELLTKKDQKLSRWKEYFEQHLNEPPDLRVEIDLPSREAIESALKYLKNNKTVGADLIAAELVKKRWPPDGGCISRGEPAGLDERDTT
jgi:hypothetical protein